MTTTEAIEAANMAFDAWAKNKSEENLASYVEALKAYKAIVLGERS